MSARPLRRGTRASGHTPLERRTIPQCSTRQECARGPTAACAGQRPEFNPPPLDAARQSHTGATQQASVHARSCSARLCSVHCSRGRVAGRWGWPEAGASTHPIDVCVTRHGARRQSRSQSSVQSSGGPGGLTRRRPHATWPSRDVGRVLEAAALRRHLPYEGVQ